MLSIVKPRDVLFVLLASTMVIAYVMTSGGGFPLDDSWIHQTYARNLAQYNEWAFIPGEPSAASTSPLYTVLLSLGYRLEIDYVLWTHGLGIMALTFLAVIGSRMANQVAPELQYGPLIVGLGLVLTWHHIWAAASGMETLLFGTLTLWLMFLVWREVFDCQSAGTRVVALRGAIFGIASALTTLARPEGIVLVALCGFVLVMIRPHGFRTLVLGGSAALVSFGAMMSPYLILNLQLTGGFLPDTAAAKFAQHAVLLNLPLATRMSDLFSSIMVGGQLLLLPGVVVFAIVVLKRDSIRQWAYLLPLLWVVALVVLYALRLPASYQHGRYVLPALPSLVLLGTIGTVMLVRWGHSPGPVALVRRVFSRVLLLAAIFVYAAFAFVNGPRIYATDVAIINEEMVATAHWIRENVPMSDVLAAHDIGAVGYFASRSLLDIAGLVSPEVVPYINDGDAIWQFLQENQAEYLVGFPNQLPNRTSQDDRLCEVFLTGGTTSVRVGGPNMAVYRLNWDGECD